MEPLLVGLFLLLAVAGGILAWLHEKKRREGMEAVAQKLGFQFDAGPDENHDEEYAQFAIFRRGHSRVAKNTMIGMVELFGRSCRAQAGDFRYRVTSGSGKNRSTQTYHFSYLLVHPPWPSPSLLVRPEGTLDKVKGAFGFDDIDFESEEFSRTFWVESSDKRFAYDVLHPRMMEFLLRERPPMLDLEHGALCISDGARRWDFDAFEAHLGFVRRFCDNWPRHLLVDLEK